MLRFSVLAKKLMPLVIVAAAAAFLFVVNQGLEPDRQTDEQKKAAEEANKLLEETDTASETAVADDTTSNVEEKDAATGVEAAKDDLADVDLQATIVTEKGDIHLKLFPDVAPIAVASFVNLVQHGFYDGLTFHRVEPGFVIQGGCPEGTGAGGPGYEFKNECAPDVLFDRAGVLGMANRGPGTNGSQFFITMGPAKHLNGGYTVFGQVLDGQDVVSRIKPNDTIVRIELTGDTASVLDAEATRIAQWNTILDSKFPTSPEATSDKTPETTSEETATSDEDEGKDPTTMKATLYTNKGKIEIELLPDIAPVTVANFVNLIKRGYYNGVRFHRVIPAFMIQGGDPTGTGSGGPGYSFEDECTPDVTFDRPGLLAMANRGPGTNGSQFFITHVPTPWLNGKHTIFGRVISGQEIVNSVEQGHVIIRFELEGDVDELLEAQKDRVDQWNAILEKNGH